MSEPLPPFLPWIKLGKQISTLPGYPRRELRKLQYYKFTYVLQYHKAIFLRLSAEGTTSLILSLRHILLFQATLKLVAKCYRSPQTFKMHTRGCSAIN
jgi:hypothetical protein